MATERKIGRFLVLVSIFAGGMLCLVLFCVPRTQKAQPVAALPTSSKPSAASKVTVIKNPESVGTQISATNADIITRLQAIRAESKTPEPEIEAIRAGLSAMMNRQKPKLFLSDAELQFLVDEVIDTMRLSGDLKAERAQVSVRPDGKITVFVPASPETASALWNAFGADLATQLPQYLNEKINSSMRDDFVTWLSGYGAANETYTFTPVRDEEGQYEFTFTAEVPYGPKSPLTKFLGGYAGSEEGDRSIALGAVVERPQFSFLGKVLSGKAPKS